jgi:MFS family permease
LASVRTARQIGLPLWALAIHLPPATTALFIAIGGAVDFALFYSSGQIMDRFGRRWAAVPTLVLTGIALISTFLASGSTGFLWLSIGLALANGIGSGVVMVIGADLAPPHARNEFLASYRMIIDAAQAATPPVLSVLAAAIGIAGSMTGFGLLAFGGAWLMYKYIPRFERH